MRVTSIAILCMVAGSVSGKTPSTYVGLGNYRDYTCTQIAQEARKVSLNIGNIAANRLGEVTTSPGKTTVSWPEELKVGGRLTSEEAVLIREQMIAIEEASIQSQCSIEFRRSAK